MPVVPASQHGTLKAEGTSQPLDNVFVHADFGV
jgi:hypothetical protein